MSETTRMRAPYFAEQMGAGPSLLLDELRILRERNEQQHAEAAELRRQIDEQAGQMALQRARIAELEAENARLHTLLRDAREALMPHMALCRGTSVPNQAAQVVGRIERELDA